MSQVISDESIKSYKHLGFGSIIISLGVSVMIIIIFIITKAFVDENNSKLDTLGNIFGIIILSGWLALNAMILLVNPFTNKIPVMFLGLFGLLVFYKDRYLVSTGDILEKKEILQMAFLFQILSFVLAFIGVSLTTYEIPPEMFLKLIVLYLDLMLAMYLLARFLREAIKIKSSIDEDIKLDQECRQQAFERSLLFEKAYKIDLLDNLDEILHGIKPQNKKRKRQWGLMMREKVYEAKHLEPKPDCIR